MSEPEKHHYLPIFYLKQWANRDGKIIRYYRPHDDVVPGPISPENTGYEEGLYGLEGIAPEDGKNRIEKKFMSPFVDDPAAKALRVLIHSDNSKLTTEHRQAWTRFVMSLLVRTPIKIKQIIQMEKEFIRPYLDLHDDPEYGAIRRPQDPPTLWAWVEQNTPAYLDNAAKNRLPGIIGDTETCDEIMNMRWVVVRIPAGCLDLLTCDFPVIMSPGVKDERCLIVVPLSPRLAFIANRSQKVIDIGLSNVEAFVTFLNRNLVGQAEKYVYGAHDGHLQFVEERLSH